MRNPVKEVPEPSPSALDGYVRKAKFAIRGRVRFSGEVTANNPQGSRTYRYLIIDADEFLKGDPFSVHPRYQKGFPLLELTFRTAGPDEEAVDIDEHSSWLEAIACRDDEAFVFFVDLPTADIRGGGAARPAPWSVRSRVTWGPSSRSPRKARRSACFSSR